MEEGAGSEGERAARSTADDGGLTSGLESATLLLCNSKKQVGKYTLSLNASLMSVQHEQHLLATLA